MKIKDQLCYMKMLVMIAETFPEREYDIFELISKEFLPQREKNYGVNYQEYCEATSNPFGKISAIKLYRKRTGLGLKESKYAIEYAMAKHGTVSHNDIVEHLRQNGMYV